MATARSLRGPLDPGLGRLARLALVLCLQGMLSVSTWASEAELKAGRALFALKTGDALQALSLIGKPESERMRMLRASAYADLGIFPAAVQDLETLANGNGPEAALARLELAKLSKGKGDIEAASRFLNQALAGLEGEARLEAKLLQAELKRLEGDLSGMAAILSKMPESPWTSIGYFNLAAAYAAQEKPVSRPVVALRVAESLAGGGEDSLGEEMADRSRIAAGYLTLRAGEYDKALSFLGDVNIDSYHAPKAFYLHGLALARQGRYRPALQYWHRAIKFPLAFPGVPDAHIAKSRAYDEEGFPGLAAEGYLTASNNFEKEIATLQTLLDDIADKGAYRAMVLASRHTDVEWFLAESRSLTKPRLAWLSRYLEKAEGQAAVRRVSELEVLISRLKERRNTLRVFEGMLVERLEALDSPRTRSQRNRLLERKKQLERRARTLRERLETAINEEQGKAPASAGERAVAELTDQRRQLNVADQQLAALDRHLGTFESRSARAPKRFQGMFTRVRQGLERTGELLERAGRLRDRAGQVLDQSMAEFLGTHRKVMNDYLDRSKQEVAHLYEYMAVQQLEQGKAAREAGQ